MWTPSSDAPAGTLSHQLEGQRHDHFIERARKGDIDLVFFGTTETEMWSWPDRGQKVWDRAFGSLKAANFGSQGTQPNSLLWRMRNGELDGYKAKLVVLQTWAPGVTPISNDGRSDTGATYAPIIAEIRARQPQARILLLPPLPRGQFDRDTWQQLATANAVAFSRLVDNETVFYVDIGSRFFLPDGSHNQAMWRYPPVSGMVNVGTQAAAYEVWAEELQPWLNRFVR
jgi:beta-glucosidase